MLNFPRQILLGVATDKNLNFQEYVFDLWNKAGRKPCFSKIVKLHEFWKKKNIT